MKKVRLVIAVVAAALMVMGVGYAAWSQTLPMAVNGDTSHIDVIYSGCSIDYDEYLDADADVAGNGKSLEVSVKDFYPNAECKFTATITNNGTMPVVIKSFTMNPLSIPIIAPNYANFVMTIASVSTTPGLNIDIASTPIQFGDDKTITLTSPVRIEPGDSFEMKYTLKMDDVGSVAGVNLYEEQDFAFLLTPYFETTSQEP